MLKKFLFTTTCLIASSVFAETPKEIKGTWFVDKVLTEEALMNKPGITEQDKKHIPNILKHMQKSSFEFTDDQLIITMGSRTKSSKIQYQNKESDIYTFSAFMRGKEGTVKVTINSNDKLNMKSSASDNMDEYLFKRFTPEEMKSHQEFLSKEAERIKIFTALNNFKSVAGDIGYNYASGAGIKKSLKEINPSPTYAKCSVTGNIYDYMGATIDQSKIPDNGDIEILKSTLPDGSYFIAKLNGKVEHIVKK